MFGKYLKKKFGKPEENGSFHSPLRIALHSTITLTTVDLLVILPSLHPLFSIPQGSLEVMAIGEYEMDDSPVHQIYMRDEAGEEFILQLVVGADYRTGKPQVDEVILFKQVVTLQPETQASLNRYLADIGFETIELDDVEYERSWGDRWTEKMDFKRFPETVITPTGKEQFVNEYILYGRTIDNPIGGEEINEYLLVGIEEGEKNAEIMMQVGFKLNLADVSVQ